MDRRWLSLILLLLCGCVLQVETTTIPADQAFVTRAVDGDTMVLDNGERVRFLCINTPEKWETHYHEATEALRAMVENQTVILQKDVSDRDKYGRLLRYVYLPDGTFVNAEMVRLGHAKAYHYPPDTSHYEEMVELEKEAKSSHLGLWNESDPSDLTKDDYPPDCDYVASVSGEVYYANTCKYAHRILEKNRLCFSTMQEALAAGYRETHKC